MANNAQTKIQLDLALTTPVLLANRRQTVYLRIGLTGFELYMKKEPLVPLHVMLVVDTSMQGVKINQAKEVVMMIIARLRPIDLITIVACDRQGEILLPTTPVQHREMICKMIETLSGSEKIALFDCMEKGVREILKYRQHYQINRMILLSDGLANVSPNSPTEIRKFCRIFAQENITITTIGLGLDYNQDLMLRFSQQGDGNHALVENVTDMTRVLEQEFVDMASVVAQEIEVRVSCNENVRPLKVLGREAKIEGHTVSVQLDQLYSEREKYILLELEISHIPNQQQQTVAKVNVVYRNLKIHRSQSLTEEITVSFTRSPQRVVENTNAIVMTAVAEQLAVEEDKLTLLLCDQDQIQEAKSLLLF